MESLLLNFLPVELVSKILYQHKGVEHPVAKELNKYFKRFDEWIDLEWEDLGWEEKPEFADVYTENMMEVKDISNTYDGWIENEIVRDEMKIECLNDDWRGTNGASKMVFDIWERTFNNYLKYRYGHAPQPDWMEIIIEEVK